MPRVTVGWLIDWIVFYAVSVIFQPFNGGCHSRCGTLKNPQSLLTGHECQAQVKICSPSPARSMSQYEWKILDWDEKPQTNKNVFSVKERNQWPTISSSWSQSLWTTKHYSASMKQLLTIVDHNSFSRESHSVADIDSNIEPSSRNLLSKNSHCVI